ncbi:hypothetical protein CK203_047550 [Vitis vinifera]|uniref:Uncharacterized protein n=1 Tax=Vitis vinifera TaxID=29760 RepID=A0A438GX13_VITVI|nr:hypothetical protein CK203_047550 [Vitis vinifera]
MGVAMGSGRGAHVVVIGGLDLPGSCGPSLARIEFDNWDFLSRCLFAEKWVESELSSRGARGIGDILTPVLVKALSLPLGPSNTDVEGALMWKPGCVTQRFLFSIFLSPGGELSAVFRLPTVSFRWLAAIQNHHPLPHQMNGFGKVRYTCKKASGQGVRTHPPMVLLAMVRERDINQLAFYQALAGASSPYKRLSEAMVGDTAVRDRGEWSCRMIVGSDLLSLHLVFSLCR